METRRAGFFLSCTCRCHPEGEGDGEVPVRADAYKHGYMLSSKFFDCAEIRVSSGLARCPARVPSFFDHTFSFLSSLSPFRLGEAVRHHVCEFPFLGTAAGCRVAGSADW
jgi:hypothetical protein